jgi:uncharacterized RDD family membrane protein YckC
MRFFKRIKLKTPESVELEFTLAGIGNRILAYLIDSLIIWTPYAFIVAPLMEWVSNQISRLEAVQDNVTGFLWMSAILTLFTFAWGGGYFVIFETFWQGQTPGKRLTKIRVIRDDGRSVGLTQASLRTIFRILDDALSIGFFCVLVGQQEKRLGDWIAGTLVIQEEVRAIGSSQLPLSGQAQNIADQLAAEVELSYLTPDDFTIIKDYLRRRDTLLPEAKIQVSQQLAQQVQQRLDINFKDFTDRSDLFLESVYLAYQQAFDLE